VARRLSRPRELARDLLVLVGARTPEQIDPIETAKELGIEVAFGDLDGATARIFRIGSKARIRVSDQIVTQGRKRMSIGHEIGHHVLGHEIPSEGDAASWFRCSCAQRDKNQERDADVFAVEHLAPEAMVAPYCAVTPVDLDAVHAIEQRFVTSPVMAAMRLVELSPQPCAVVYSEHGRIVWMKPSKTFPSYFARGTVLATDSIAGGYFDRGKIEPGPRTTLSASCWFGSRSRIAPNLEITEHAMVVPEPGWGGVLSLLWLPQSIAHCDGQWPLTKQLRLAPLTVVKRTSDIALLVET
jgi:Zn-dependent peptidase ImmA (M78 family)